jgi:hypothetical protein
VPKVSLAILIFLISSAASATVTDLHFSGAYSGYDETLSSLKLYVGRAARSGFACADSTSRCSSCEGTANGGNPDICNETYVPASSSITFTYKSSSKGYPKLTGGPSGTGTKITISGAGTVEVEAGQTITFSALWSDICAATKSDSTCGIDHTGTLKVGVALSNSDDAFLDSASIAMTLVGNSATFLQTTSCSGLTTDLGLCDYTLFPGDEKAYVENLNSNNMPTGLSGLYFNRIRFYYVKVATTADCATASFVNNPPGNATAGALDIGVDTTGDKTGFLQNDILQPLENDGVYCFRTASIDQAGNIGFWTTTVKDVSPSEVVGYFTETQNCFVATAAYGSTLDPHVGTFREFRDKILLNSFLGKKFVNFYYLRSPHWASIISKSETLRSIARIGLWPFWLMAKISLKISWPATLALFFSIGAFFIWLLNRGLANARSKSFSPFAKWISIFFLALGFVSLIPALAEAAVKRTNTAEKRKPDAEKPPREFPYPGASEEPDESPTPLKTPKTKKKVVEQKNPNDPVVVRISKEGEYFYKRKASEQTSAWALRFGSLQIGDVVNPDTNLAFGDVYASSGTVLFFDYEWQLFKFLGKIGLKLGSGVFVTQGTGRFLTGTKAGQEAKEQYTFVMFPNNLSAIYRAQFWEKQLIVPFVEGGGGYYTFVEVRDDFKRTKYGGVPIAQWAVGGSLLLDFLDPAAMVELDEDNGINHLWLTAEFRSITSFKDTFDISNNIISAGFLFEY